MNQLHTIVPTIVKEWKAQAINTSHIYKLLGDVSRAVALAWIVYQSGQLGTLAYVSVGVALIAIWTGVLSLGGWSLDSELYGKTLDFTLISRTSMSVVLFSKTIAQTIYEMPTGIVSFVTVLLVARALPEIANIPSLILSLLVALVGLIVIGFFFSALVVLVGGKAGFFMGIMPFGAVLSGFILPVNQLPLAMEVLARLTPSSWAMDSVWLSIGGIDSWWLVMQGWGMCLLMTAVWFIITYYICKGVERRIRVLGTLGAF